MGVGIEGKEEPMGEIQNGGNGKQNTEKLGAINSKDCAKKQG